MQKEILDDLKRFNWQTIVDFGNSLNDLNDSQWRFLKGLVAELTLETHADNNLVYVGDVHKDYDWPKYKLSVELKSQLSDNMYTKKENLRKNYTIKLNNSNGTNSKDQLQDHEIADLLIVIRNDGAFVLDKKTVKKNAKKQGDGFIVIVDNSKIVEISGKITQKTQYQSNLKQIITAAIKHAIPSI